MRNYHSSLTISLFGLLGQSYAAPTVSKSHVSSRSPENLHFVALGDSFSSGIGAGSFVSSNVLNDADTHNECARTDGSYPFQLSSTLSDIRSFDFFSCSGDQLQHIPGQLDKLSDEPIDAVSLSISGNDFFFSDVVRSCVYPHRFMENRPDDPVEACNDLLQQAEDAISDLSDTGAWANFRQSVEDVRQHLTPEGHIYITGYPRFFSPDGNAEDECNSSCFFPGLLQLICLVDLTWDVRSRMNQLVESVNQNIVEQVIEPLNQEDGQNIHFVNIDGEPLDGHRFCEPNKPIFGDEDEDVWFVHIGSDIIRPADWEGPRNEENNMNDLVPPPAERVSLFGSADSENEDDDSAGFSPFDFLDEYQQNSVFHPKRFLHQYTANQIAFQILQNQLPQEEVINGGSQFCMGSNGSGGDDCFLVPEGCAVRRPVDDSMPTVFCESGRDAELESVPSS